MFWCSTWIEVSINFIHVRWSLRKKKTELITVITALTIGNGKIKSVNYYPSFKCRDNIKHSQNKDIV